MPGSGPAPRSRPGSTGSSPGEPSIRSLAAAAPTSRTSPEEAADPSAGPAAQAERNLAAGAVTDALAALPFAQRAVVLPHHFEGLSYAEVAEVTRSTVPAGPQPLVPARRTLGMKLQEWR